MADLTGRTLGQYRLHELIGHGGMADVYRATQPSIGREVAIKVLPAHFLQDRTFLERFTREVQVIAGLQHPHILPVYDFGEQDGTPYIVMAYLAGGSLADRIHREGGLPLAEAARLVEQIADGLEYAHEKGIIHRDFKPSNVLLDAKGNAYLADFGIAKVAESTAQLTGSGIVGTPTYMAPEMSHSGGVSPLVDVYALGVTLYQMLTGRAPYEADTPMGVLMAHLSQPIPDARDLRPDLPDAVQQVIERAMAKEPRDRYPSPRDLARDLAAAVAGRPLAEATRPALHGAATLVETPSAFAATLPDVPSTGPTASAIPEGRPVQPPVIAPARPARRRSAWMGVVVGGVVLVALCVVAGILFLPGFLPGLLNPASTGGTGVEPTRVAVGQPPTDRPPATAAPTEVPQAARVAVVLVGEENDRGFNEYALRGAREAAEELGLAFDYAASPDSSAGQQRIESFAAEGYGLIVTVGFLPGDGLAQVAVAHPDVRFVIIDHQYNPDASGHCPGDPVTVTDDCYRDVLPNVTSVIFAEDEAGYLAGYLAGCMTQTGVVGSVAGMEIPPVQRFVTGYQHGARSINPGVQTLNVYLPSFTDPTSGHQAAQQQIANGADVIFAVAGYTGNGALLAAHEAGLMAIGVDVDQYYTYPEVAASLLTSASKYVDLAAANVVRDFAAGRLEPGVQRGTVANGGVGLAPYHDWQTRIPQACQDAVEAAREGLASGTLDTGWED